MTVSELNEHILIHGSSKSGKTERLMQIIREKSRSGISSFVSDTKGECISLLMNPDDQCPYPIELWDTRGEQGLPMRTSVSDLGPTLLTRMLELNSIQEGLLRLCYRMEDENGYLLLDLPDLQALLSFIQKQPSSVPSEYGQVSVPSLSAIARRLLKFQDEGLAPFFGEPALDTRDLISWGGQMGQINLLHCEGIVRHKAFYETVFLWLLSALIEECPESGEIRFAIGIEMGDSCFIDAQLFDLLLRRGIQLILVSEKILSNLPDSVHVIEVTGRAQPILRRSMRVDQDSRLYKKYKQTLDPPSAREMLSERITAIENQVLIAEGSKAKKKKGFSFLERMASSAASTVGREFGKELSRGILDILKRK